MNINMTPPEIPGNPQGSDFPEDTNHHHSESGSPLAQPDRRDPHDPDVSSATIAESKDSEGGGDSGLEDFFRNLREIEETGVIPSLDPGMSTEMPDPRSYLTQEEINKIDDGIDHDIKVAKLKESYDQVKQGEPQPEPKAHTYEAYQKVQYPDEEERNRMHAKKSIIIDDLDGDDSQRLPDR